MPTRVVRPGSWKIEISGGDWLLVKKRLNHGERQDAMARRYITDVFGTRVNMRMAGMELVTAYLLDWSLTDLEEKPLVIRGQSLEVVEAALNAIDDDSFAEIKRAIEAHDDADALARAEEKKSRDGATGSAVTSPSPAPADGATSGSVN